ncbi:hypothetical protein [Streptomyces sp. NPDC046685]|uniref:hypothetical protein n=1 Tax=Streptomyces sp. NPDC046685 TaxID=3157202 RepID=UPI00340FC770
MVLKVPQPAAGVEGEALHPQLAACEAALEVAVVGADEADELADRRGGHGAPLRSAAAEGGADLVGVVDDGDLVACHAPEHGVGGQSGEELPELALA